MSLPLGSVRAILANSGVNLARVAEILAWSFFDSASYVAAGQPTLNFFALPQGQGTGFGGGTKTASDTNITNAAMLPAGQMFLLESVEVRLQPTTPSVTAQLPAAFGAEVAAQIVNDAYIVGRSGNLLLTIGSKPYLADGPISRFPAQSFFDVTAAVADASTVANNQQSRIAMGSFVGPLYDLGETSILIPSGQNFSVTLGWPEGNQTITNPLRIFVHLNGYLIRNAQ